VVAARQPAAPAAQINREPALLVNHQDVLASQITVRVPADAQLFVNDDLCPLTSETRTFKTPALKSDRDYTYTLRAEVVRNGRTVSETKRVVFQGGRAVDVEFRELGVAPIVRR